MSLHIDNRDGKLELHLPAVLDLPAATELRGLLLEALARDDAAGVTLACDGVERLSTAAAQVILAAAATFAAAGRQLTFQSPSARMAEGFHHLGLGADITASP